MDAFENNMPRKELLEGRRLAVAKDVTFVVEENSLSNFGVTSPRPRPSWKEVTTHLTTRLRYYDSRLRSTVVSTRDLLSENATLASSAANTVRGSAVVLVLGVKDPEALAAVNRAVGASPSSETPVAVLGYDLGGSEGGSHAGGEQLREFVDSYEVPRNGRELRRLRSQLRTGLVPWGRKATGKRLSEQVLKLIGRNSSEDLMYAVFFVLHAYVMDIEVVSSDINPSWEKGVVRNVKEIKNMVDNCRGEILAAVSDPQTRTALDLLNSGDLRDQVGSYRVVVSYETPQLEDFTLCILQQNNCFNCSAPILTEPRVPVLKRWRGQPLDAQAGREIFIGHLDHPAANPVGTKRPWSWKIVCGANPAYDAFPAQHQIFYPVSSSPSSLWYDPVFKVETIDGRSVWCKRHYRCNPRSVPADLAATTSDRKAGAWTLTTLDNGVISREHWTTVDAADDLSWAVFHYSGAAAAAGQTYVGALLLSADGFWPADAVSGPGFDRIAAAFRSCGLELWELYGHGNPVEGSTDRASFMWTETHEAWEKANPPPLDLIGDETVQAWRARVRAEEAANASL